MRKRFKRKKHSCGLCKPNKVGWASRWKGKDLALLKAFAKERRFVLHASQYAAAENR